jgi:tetratricopeptide (TPR) repeat protein
VAAAWLGLKRLRARGVRSCLTGVDPPADWRAPETRIAFGAWPMRKRWLVGCSAAVIVAVLLALIIPPARTDYAVHSAELLHITGHGKEAVAKCQSVLDRQPDNRLAHELLAACYFEEGRLQDGIAESNRAMELGTMDLGSYMRLAAAYESLGELEQAKRVWQEYLVTSPYNRDSWDMMRERGLLVSP